MRNLPIYPNPKANVFVDQRDRWFAWGQAVGLFGSLLNQRFYYPMTSYNNTTPAYIDMAGGGNNAAWVTSGLLTGIMDGPVNAVRTPGNTTDYLSVADHAQIECANPVMAFWAKLIDVGAFGSFASRTRGVPDLSYGFRWDNPGVLALYLSPDGTNSTTYNPASPADVTKWNFYAFQHRSATITNVLVNDTLTIYNSGYATIYTAGASSIRIGLSLNADIALVALANDNSANCVQKLLGLYYHSRYAFRDDWT